MGAKKNKKKQIPKKNIKRKIKYKNIFIFLLIIFIFGYGIHILLSLKITNIYISGNEYLSDQEILEKGQLQDYPPIINTLSFILEKKFTKDILIENVKIEHKKIRELHITITENKPLYYDSTKEKIILKDGSETEKHYNVPILLNYIPDKKQETFINKMKKINTNILGKISEIKYDPNDKDEDRFLLSMNDGNYVYLTLSKFEKIDRYLNIMVEISNKFDNQKGILYLDSGQYFKVLEN